MGPRKRQLHEQPYTEIVKSGTIRIASFFVYVLYELYILYTVYCRRRDLTTIFEAKYEIIGAYKW